MVKTPVVCPPAMLSEAGTDAAALLEDRFICAPAGGAGIFSVTVPCAEVPAVTVDGEITSEGAGTIAPANSYVPMSVDAPCGLTLPSMSLRTLERFSPLSIAGEEDDR